MYFDAQPFFPRILFLLLLLLFLLLSVLMIRAEEHPKGLLCGVTQVALRYTQLLNFLHLGSQFPWHWCGSGASWEGQQTVPLVLSHSRTPRAAFWSSNGLWASAAVECWGVCCAQAAVWAVRQGDSGLVYFSMFWSFFCGEPPFCNGVRGVEWRQPAACPVCWNYASAKHLCGFSICFNSSIVTRMWNPNCLWLLHLAVYVFPGGGMWFSAKWRRVKCNC